MESEVKETGTFLQVLSLAKETFQHWYNVSQESLPWLNPESISLLSEEEFQDQFFRSQPTNNLLIRALLNLGVKREEILATLQGEQGYLAYSFEPQKHICISERRFRSLFLEDLFEQNLAAMLLGMGIIDSGVALLPDQTEIGDEDDIWRPMVRGEIGRFFDGYSERISLERQSELETAREIFNYFMEEDSSLQFLARGAEVIVMIEQEGELQPLVGLASEFNQAVTASLSRRLKRRFVVNFAGWAGLDEKKALEVFEQTIKRIPLGLENFLRSLKIDDYNDLFAAFSQSQIPQIYLERRKIRSKLPTYPVN